MSDDLEDKIKQIASMLSNKDDMSNDVKNIVDMFTKMKNNDEPASSESDNLPVESNDSSDDAVQTMLMLKKFMDLSDNKHDPKVNLLKAMKPLLRKSRQDKVSNCIKFLGISKAAKYLDLDKNGFL